ncbi:MAG: DUF4401 domain-containing protein [Planctomycetes bacterium]|nr:DUF4401 domain-containing protein [Planctomycetota bacterium]
MNKREERQAAWWQSLQEAAVVNGEQAQLKQSESPWLMKVILGFSGWFASIFLFAFVAILFGDIWDSGIFLLIIGGLLSAGAYVLFKQKINDFLEHIALATSFTGQAMFLCGIFQFTDHQELLFVSLACAHQIASAIFMPHYIHRVLSAAAATVFMGFALLYAHCPYAFSAVCMAVLSYLWLNDYKFQRHAKAMRACAYGIILALVYIKATMLLASSTVHWIYRDAFESWMQPWMGDVLASAVLIWVVCDILRKNSRELQEVFSRKVIFITIILSVASFELSGLNIGLLLIVLGFSSANRFVFSMGVLSLLFFISSYYYLLEVTLLDKAIILAIVGVVLLALRKFVLKGISLDEVAENG